jgi:GT2 family glycosyltransferase
MFFFSVIIPTSFNSKYLVKCLQYLNKQTYKNFEVIIVSENKINLDLKNYSIKINIYRISKKKKFPGFKRNYAANKSKSVFLAFIDDDAYPDKNWLLNAKKKISEIKENFFLLGGPGILPKDVHFLSKVIDLSFRSSFYGSGSLRYERVKKFYDLNKIDDWPSVNMFIKKSLFIKLNGFDDNYWPGEDSKLCNKLIVSNGKIFYDPNVYVFHYRRSSISKHIKQIFRYSFTRGIFFQQKYKNSRKLNYILPSLFNVVILIFFYFSVKISSIIFFFIIFVFYLDFSLKKGCKENSINFFSSLLAVLNIVTYGFGFASSFFLKNYKTKLGR